jgi:peptide/nickel transport system permease protein
LSETAVIYKHALPNALSPVITLAGTSFGLMLGGTLVIETVFSIPGVGSYMIGAVNNRDYPVVQGCVIFLAITFSLVMLVVDLLYAFVNPRIRAQYEGKKRRKHV